VSTPVFSAGLLATFGRRLRAAVVVGVLSLLVIALTSTSPARTSVLLVHGTAVAPEENWGPTYLPVLLDRGHAACTVRLPDYATRDVQANTEYVVTAIRAMAAASSRRISIIGHSQGALLSHTALRMWSDLSPHVDDVIGLAGVYDRGSQDIAARCQSRCPRVLHQLAPGSAFLQDIARRALPTGPAYTNIGTIGDSTVTPQPAAHRARDRGR
jgi:triacylglycerol lipase